MADSAAAQPENVEVPSGEELEETIETMKLNVKLPIGDEVSISIPTSETALEIRLYLAEQKDSWFYSSFHLEVAGKSIDESVPLSAVPDLKEGSTISIVEDDYDERTSRLHVLRVRDVISMAVAHSDSGASPSALVDLSDEKSPYEGFKCEELPTQAGQEPKEIPQLTAFFPKPASVAPKCVHRIAFSGFNPAPGYRRMQGDFFYLDVTTLEGETICVTASARGFFVNNSKVPNTNGSAAKFDPTNKDAKNGKIHRTLVQCLSAASTQFSRLIGEVAARLLEKSVQLEQIPVNFPVYPWLSKPRPHEHDTWRSEDQLKVTYELDLLQGSMGPDWNEELQSAREMPRDTLEERIARDTALFRFHGDFVDNVTRGAQAILNGAVQPLNPQDDKKLHMFLQNNLFFFYPTDNQEIFKDYGGDEAAYKNLCNDLHNLAAFKEADPEGLYTMEMAIVNYRGHRLVGHTLIPGLLQRISKGEDVVVYGSADNKKVADSESFLTAVREKLAKALHLDEHTVKDKTETPKEHTTVGSVELKGVEGTDRRKYLIDMARLTPRDINYKSRPQDIVCVFRQELINGYISILIQEEVAKVREAEAKEKGAEANKEKTEEEEEDEIQKSLDKIKLPELAYNNDLHTNHTLTGPADKNAESEKRLEDLARFLKEDVLGMFTHDVARGLIAVMDGDQLVSAMHSRGINLRYLGALATSLAGPESPFRDVFLREMIVRAARRVFSSQLQKCREYELASKTAEFLNAFFGRPSNNPKGSRSGLAPLVGEAAAASSDAESLGELTHSALWTRVRALVEEKYAFTLPEWIPSSIFELPTLRLLCLRTGIRLDARQYDLTVDKPFEAANVSELVPLVKHKAPQSRDAAAFFEQGKQLIEARRFDKAHDALIQTLYLLQQVYGNMHKDIAECHSILAHVSQYFNEFEQAWAHQQSAAIIFERVTGADSRQTVNAFGNLALITRKIQRPLVALNYIRRAVFLNLISAGSHNPEMWNLFLQLSDTLAEAGKKEEAVDAAKRALLHAEPYLGLSNSVIMAQLLHALAIRLSAVHSFREALAYEKRSNSLYTVVLGEKHARTEESNMWLQKLTKMAVQSEIDSKKKGVAPASKVVSAAAAAVAAAPSQSSAASGQALHTLPISQLVQYINTPAKRTGVASARGRVVAGGSSSVRTVASKPAAATSKPAAAPAAAPANGTSAEAQGKKKGKKTGK